MTTRKTRANAGAKPAPPSRVRCKLSTIDDVKLEIARLYREGKAGTRPIADVSRMANVLFLLGRIIEGADLEREVRRLEAERQKLQEEG